MTNVIFIEHGTNKILHKATINSVPIKGQGVQIKKTDYIVIAVKWFFNDFQVVQIVLEPSKP